MARRIRRNAVRLIGSDWCMSRRERRQKYEKSLEKIGGKKGRSLLETQMRFFDLYFMHPRNRRVVFASRLMASETFKSALRDAFKRKNRRGTSVSLLAPGEIVHVAEGVEEFARKHNTGNSIEEFERVLKKPKWREDFLRMVSDHISSFSPGNRFQEMTKSLVTEMKKAGMKNPVVIDYGTGSGEYTVNLENKLRSHGIKPNIIATDKNIRSAAQRDTRGTKVALLEQDLRKGTVLGKHKKADVVRLGWVLPYYLQENAGRMIRNAVRDVRTGGLIVVGGARDRYAIYRKTGAETVEKIAGGPKQKVSYHQPRG